MKILILITGFLIIASICSLVLLPISILNSDVRMANETVGTEYDYFAYQIYEKAEEDWPFLKVNLDFQNKYTKAKLIKDQYYLKKPAIYIFLRDNTPESEIKDLINSIEELDYVTKIEYTTKAKALQIYKERNKANSTLIEPVTEEMLPASIDVFMDDWSKQSEFEQLVKGNYIITDAIATPMLP